MWKNPESRSGFGSTLEATATIRQELETLLRAEGIETMLDIPCGDFNWMKHVSFNGRYIGADIVPELITTNQRLFSSNHRAFSMLNLVEDELPASDLVFCRECLNHLSLSDARAALGNLIRATKKVFVATDFPGVILNTNQESTFRFRPLNLTIEPFRLRRPDKLICEHYADEPKVLAVWFCSNGAILIDK